MIGETISDRLKKAREDAGWKSASAFAAANDIPTGTYIGHENGSRGLKEHAVQTYARLLNVSPKWLMFGGAVPAEGTQEDLPIYASAQGGGGQVLLFDTEPVEYTTRPSSLLDVPDGFGVIIVGDSMEPAYRSGDTLYVNPRLKVDPSMDVLVIRVDRKAGQKLAMVKHLLFRTAEKLHLRQYNPEPGQPQDFTLDTEEVAEVQAVVGMERNY